MRGPPLTPYKFRKDRSLFWTITMVGLVLTGITWLALHYVYLLNR